MVCLPQIVRQGPERMEDMNRKLWGLLSALVLFGGLLVPAATATQGNKEVLFTVNGPIEIPHRVLGPGRYELKLIGFGSPIVGVWNATGTHLYGFFETEPAYRNHATGKTKVVLSGSGKYAPKRLDEWFYPGDNTGNALLYPSVRNTIVAKNNSGTHKNASQRIGG
jgi:hypothetical protein